MEECHILPQRISDLLMPLRALIASLSISQRMPQVEYAGGEDLDVLVLRKHGPADRRRRIRHPGICRSPQRQPAVAVAVLAATQRTGQLLSVLSAGCTGACYRLPEFGVEMPYKPTEFTQVNPHQPKLVSRALKLLDPQRERIADMFCGLGNFTLPIARSGAIVLGMEGSQQLIERAVQNATHNGLEKTVRYRMANLFDVTPESFAKLGRFDKSADRPAA